MAHSEAYYAKRERVEVDAEDRAPVTCQNVVALSANPQCCGLQNAAQDRSWSGRTACNCVAYGGGVGDAAAGGVAGAKNSAACAAVSDGDYQFGVGDGVVGAAQGFFHVGRDWARYQQQVGVARAGDEFDACAFEVVVRIVKRMNLKLAAIARARIDVADREGAAENFPQILLQC